MSATALTLKHLCVDDIIDVSRTIKLIFHVKLEIKKKYLLTKLEIKKYF